MAKKPLAAFKKSIAPRNRTPKSSGLSGLLSNPSCPKEIGDVVIPGAASYVVHRGVTQAIENRLGGAALARGILERNISTGVALTLLFGAWYAGRKVKSLGKYQAGMLVGTTISTLQHLLSKYMPKLGLLLGLQPADAAPAQASLGGTQRGPHAPMGALPRRKRTRFVSPGEIDGERRNEEVLEAQAQADYSSVSDYSNDYAPVESDEYSGGVSNDEVASIVDETADVQDDYGNGIFAQ